MPVAAADFPRCSVVLSVYVAVRRQAGPLLLALLLGLCKPSLHPTSCCDVCWLQMCRGLEAGSICQHKQRHQCSVQQQCTACHGHSGAQRQVGRKSVQSDMPRTPAGTHTTMTYAHSHTATCNLESNYGFVATAAAALVHSRYLGPADPAAQLSCIGACQGGTWPPTMAILLHQAHS
jgi:hypothetical protein